MAQFRGPHCSSSAGSTSGPCLTQDRPRGGYCPPGASSPRSGSPGQRGCRAPTRTVAEGSAPPRRAPRRAGSAPANPAGGDAPLPPSGGGRGNSPAPHRRTSDPRRSSRRKRGACGWGERHLVRAAEAESRLAGQHGPSYDPLAGVGLHRFSPPDQGPAARTGCQRRTA